MIFRKAYKYNKPMQSDAAKAAPLMRGVMVIETSYNDLF